MKLLLILIFLLISCKQVEPVREKDHTRGMQIYISICSACHGFDGEGGNAPNLTDNFYIYGHQKSVVEAIIKHGIEGKGMPGWGHSLSEKDLQALTDYVVSLQGLNLPGKEPEGEIEIKKYPKK